MFSIDWYSNPNASTMFNLFRIPTTIEIQLLSSVGIPTQMVLTFLDYLISRAKFSFGCIKLVTIFGLVDTPTQMILKFLGYLVSQPKFSFGSIKLCTILGLVDTLTQIVMIFF